MQKKLGSGCAKLQLLAMFELSIDLHFACIEVKEWIPIDKRHYMQRFDPGFGFNGGPYSTQPMYSLTLNYNTEFPQLGSTYRPHIFTEHQPHLLPHHLPGSWAASSNPAGLRYGHPETMVPPFNPNHVGAHSTAAIYMHSLQYPCQRPGMPFIHPRELVHQPFSQVNEEASDSWRLSRNIMKYAGLSTTSGTISSNLSQTSG